ncbi:hypothetical protein FQA47_024435 [Oryzias melastigma]|uniref:Uncharacterized protein n=1 Tax=Oryzias melastigma TaxID=30732 RepID=A0A834KVB8_ORYME|nr:hypothetical protein FQA47_024435 [Oryzias melastigma]
MNQGNAVNSQSFVDPDIKGGIYSDMLVTKPRMSSFTLAASPPRENRTASSWSYRTFFSFKNSYQDNGMLRRWLAVEAKRRVLRSCWMSRGVWRLFTSSKRKRRTMKMKEFANLITAGSNPWTHNRTRLLRRLCNFPMQPEQDRLPC